MLQPVFDGVAAMHQVGLVHRGICPENIRVLENGRARLTGYATVGLRTAGSGLHEQLYEGYSAPEQYSTAEFEGRYTDEYSLAAVVYRMVCGQSPGPGSAAAGVGFEPARPHTGSRRCRSTSLRCCWLGLKSEAGGAHPDRAPTVQGTDLAGVYRGADPQPAAPCTPAADPRRTRNKSSTCSACGTCWRPSSFCWPSSSC